MGFQYKSVRQSLITVIGTGSTQLSSVQALGYDSSRPRDIFVDVPLAALPDICDTEEYNSTVSRWPASISVRL